MPGESGSERRLSNSSDGSAASASSHSRHETADFVSLRPHTTTVLPGRPAGNPLQFVRVPPAPLTPRARAQLQSNTTRSAPRLDAEDWQSNLDSWKSSRRKRVEHIIERCVETRRLEQVAPACKTKHKTFNEMLEERGGSRRVGALALYLEEEPELNLRSAPSEPSEHNGAPSEPSEQNFLLSEHNERSAQNATLSERGKQSEEPSEHNSRTERSDERLKNGAGAKTAEADSVARDEAPEYTYEGAIEGYKSRIIHSVATTPATTNTPTSTATAELDHIRTALTDNIDQKLAAFHTRSDRDTKPESLRKDLPKVDINKRRELFERENSRESSVPRTKLPELSNKTSVKERLSSLERYSEDTPIPRSNGKLSADVKPLKERMSFLDKVKSSADELDKIKSLSNDLSNARSLKERLSSLQSQTAEEDIKILKTEVKEVSMSLKERLSCLDAAKNKDIPKLLYEDSLSNTSKSDSYDKDDSVKSSLTGIENQMQSFCRSLDSLDINGQSSPSSFERVQSYEDFDCAEIQNNTALSDIETEDSGIHTARDSCAPADDIADLTQVASPIGEPMVEASEYESSNEDVIPLHEPTKIEEPRHSEPFNAIPEDIIVEEFDDQDCKTENTDSASNYHQAVSQPEDLSVTEEVTEIQYDKEDEDTLKSLENQDTSVVEALEQAFELLDSSHETSVTQQQPPAGNMMLPLEMDELLEPPRVRTPPREKPPPPPPEEDGEDVDIPSSRRIRRELHNKRSSFLGLSADEGDYEQAATTLPQPPDITAFLRREAREAKALYRQTLSEDGRASEVTGGARHSRHHIEGGRDSQTENSSHTAVPTDTTNDALDRRLQESQVTPALTDGTT